MTSRDGNPVTVQKHRLVLENKVFKVYLDDLTEAGGVDVSDYLVVEPKSHTDQLVSGIGVLPVRDGRVGLLRLYRHAIGDLVWELPRGFVDRHEQPVQAAIRELEEETGLSVDPQGLRTLGYFLPEAGVLKGRLQLFVADPCVVKRPYQATELGHRELRWFAISEALTMAELSEIQDPSTLIALYRCFASRR